jgi:carbon monoxide dehydrogenase subunit G
VHLANKDLAMKIAASYTLHSPRAQVWPLIQDPASLVRLIPGCEQLDQVSPTKYRGQLTIPVAAVAGTYSTCVHLLEDP